ncbi:hypothetical protein BGZ94_000357 [Podila epigama]|nr:hypothetical protein BGZ94_000357 [Podila epigama]
MKFSSPSSIKMESSPLSLSTTTTTVERQHWFLTDLLFFLYHTICTFHVIVPLLYWGYISYSGEAKMMAVDLETNSLWRNYSFHGGDLVLMMIEIAINRMPFVPTHVVVVFGVCFLYLAEAHLVHYVDGFWIYPFLDTSGGPLWVVMYLGVGFVILCAFVIMYYLHRIRNWLRVKYSRHLHLSYADSTTLGRTSMDKACIHDREETMGYIDQMSRVILNPSGARSKQNHGNRKRSCSDCSNTSNASTLVEGGDDTIEAMTKTVVGQESKTLDRHDSVRTIRLEKVEEVAEEDEQEHNEKKEKRDPKNFRIDKD